MAVADDINALTISLELWEFAGYFSAAVVAISVAGEVAHDFNLFKSIDWWREKGGRTCGLILVAALVAEVVIQVQVSSISGMQIAVLQRQAAVAIQKAEEERTARLKLLSEVSSRHLTADSAKQLIEDLRGKIQRITVVKTHDEEAVNFATELIAAFTAAGIETGDVFAPPPPLGYITGLYIVYDEHTQREQAVLLRNSLLKLQVGSVNETIASPTMNDGYEALPNVQRPALYVGLKTPPFPQRSEEMWKELNKLNAARPSR